MRTIKAPKPKKTENEFFEKKTKKTIKWIARLAKMRKGKMPIKELLRAIQKLNQIGQIRFDLEGSGVVAGVSISARASLAGVPEEIVKHLYDVYPGQFGLNRTLVVFTAMYTPKTKTTETKKAA